MDSGPLVKVFLLAELENEILTLSVRDNGPGIPEKLKDSLFKPVQSKKENGSGIGLAICKELAERADATVSLDKSTNKGSSFTVAVPLGHTDN